MSKIETRQQVPGVVIVIGAIVLGICLTIVGTFYVLTFQSFQSTITVCSIEHSSMYGGVSSDNPYDTVHLYASDGEDYTVFIGIDGTLNPRDGDKEVLADSFQPGGTYIITRPGNPSTVAWLTRSVLDATAVGQSTAGCGTSSS